MTFSKEFIERFWCNVLKSNGCWLWLAGTDRKGYGAISYNGQMFKAHRVAFYLEHGRWPTPCGLHGCDRPACVRVGPGHVFEGTPADNSADMVRKGRSSHVSKNRGAANPASRVSPDTVREIRALSKSGLSLRKIAARVGISDGQVGNIVKRKHWGWVE